MNYNGLAHMRTRLNNSGGTAQQDRMIAHKKKTLDKATLYSYQGAKVRLLGSEQECRALINPNQVKQDYDDKILSIGYEYSGFVPGAIFEWLNTDTKWLIYLQDLTELAYFKGDVRKCTYEIFWEDANGATHSTFAALRGPKETSLNSIIKNNISIDIPNYTVYFMVPRNEETLAYFKRYTKFYLHNADTPTCWRIEAVDSITTPGIIEVDAVEYYANETEDDLEEGIVGGKIEVIEPSPSEIEGPSAIKPNIKYLYHLAQEANEYIWEVPSGLPISWNIDNDTLELTWEANYSGNFIISCNGINKEITAKSLF